MENGHEKIVGVTSTGPERANVVGDGGPNSMRAWIDATCDSCLSQWSAPPSTFQWLDTKSTWCNGLTGDSDGDGVADWEDNCPTVPNADQQNCHDRSDWLIHGSLKGDACDPTPCFYLNGVGEKVSVDSTGAIKTVGPAQVYYRGVGYADAANHRWENLDAYYCGCQNPARTDIYAQDYVTDLYCRTVQCPTGGVIVSDTDTDTGWHRVKWTAYQDSLNAPYTSGSQSCTPATLDSSSYLNDCDEPVPARLARKLYAGTSLGGKPMDAERFWTAASEYRTRAFTWAWQTQDYPHPGGTPYVPPDHHSVPPSVLPQFKAKAFLWLRPAITELIRYADHYSSVALELGYFFSPILPEALLKPLRYQVPETMVVPGQALWMPGPPENVVALHPLAAGRPTTGIDHLLWQNPPANAATIGLVVKQLRPTNEDLGHMMPSSMSSGAPVTTTEFAAARWEEDDLYIFGGRTLEGDRPSRLWHGWPSTDGQGNPIYLWEVAAEGGPSGRTGAVLVPDLARGRLVLMLGESNSGPLQDAWIFDVSSSTWTQAPLQVAGLTPRSHVGLAVTWGWAFLYGGRQGEVRVDGLFEVDLATLEGVRLYPASSPGARSGAALVHAGRVNDLLLYGGSDQQQLYGDLWRFSMEADTWTQVSADGGTGGPPAMENASLALCPATGAVTVVAGQPATNPAEPLWRCRRGSWESYSQITATQP